MAPTAVPNTEPETSATPTVSLETAVEAGVLQHVPSKKREIVPQLKSYKIQYEAEKLCDVYGLTRVPFHMYSLSPQFASV
jgi:hypothetical protein